MLGGGIQSLLLREIEIETDVKLKRIHKFCYMGDTLCAGGGVEDAARVRCAWV